MEKNYRLRTEVGKDQVVHAHLRQDIDFLEILSLKIKQEDFYKLHVSNYGVIVGRVLANEAFGIPNARVSVFIPLDDIDMNDSDIVNLYPYTSLQTLDKENRRYNLLPNESNDDCYKVVGTFPNKRMVLDNDTEIEVYEKYWKYTTVTNQSGDYMIFGVPKGSQQVHVDVDLSDIGILSQKPRDFVYKGYNIEQFDNASQFKDSTNLDSLTQLFSQNSSVYVYPFWGETDVEEIAITRCDLQIQYKFEPTCVFFGSIVSDNYSNNINHKCGVSKHAGFNRNLIAGEGTIEMIRKTTDGLIEEFPIQGNKLIDGNGVWCYQIPMNLDYVGTDEFGNIIPTDNPNKGIATRTSVRFRVSMQETDNEGVSRHRAKYLVPNNFELVSGDNLNPSIENPNEYDQCFEFGSATPDKYFRDLYWNKVYTVKNYIPRLQTNGSQSTQKYSAIRTVNTSGNLNPFPFNHARFRLVFAYRLLCVVTLIVIRIINIVNSILAALACFRLKLGFNLTKNQYIKIIDVYPFKWLCGESVHCISLDQGLTEDSDDNSIFVPGCKNNQGTCNACVQNKDNKHIETNTKKIEDIAQQTLAQEYDVVNLDFYNDWVNGVLYFPLWFLKRTKKRKYLWGLINIKAKNKFCDCDNEYNRLRTTENCSLEYDNHYNSKFSKLKAESETYHKLMPKEEKRVKFGIIKEFVNKLGKKIYYYSPGKPTVRNYANIDDNVDFVRLYSTDIVLLGSLNECDLDGLPRPYINMPTTSANIPYINALTSDENDDGAGIVEMSGMDFMYSYKTDKPKYGKGLFMGMSCDTIITIHKTCVNLHRMSELGVSLDTHVENAVPGSTPGVIDYTHEILADGMITRYEITDNETRSMFASLNHNGLTNKVYNSNTGYDRYDLKYKYSNDFDGHMSSYASTFTKDNKVKTNDVRNEEYIKYKFGENSDNEANYLFYSKSGNIYQFPVFNNSFYFYFGLNEGNTALDKFNHLFYSTCYKNEKYPFSMTYTTIPKPWCDDSVSAEIDVSFSGIKVPYSYKLINSSNEIVLESNDEVTKDLKIIGENGNLLENDVYTLIVTDIDDNVMNQTIEVKPIYIGSNHDTVDLGMKYENGNDKEIKEQDTCGKLILRTINVDGIDYGISNIERVTTFADIKYEEIANFILTLDGYNEDVYLTLNGYCEYDDDYISEFQADEYFSGFKKNDDGFWEFYFTRPCYLQMILVLSCNELNRSVTNLYISNGKAFMGFLNNVPIEFISGTFGKSPSQWDDVVTKPGSSLYSFPVITDGKLTENGYASYNKFMDLEATMDENVGAENRYYILTDNDKANIITYKLSSMFALIKGTVIVDDNNVVLSLTHQGGTSPVVYRAVYPDYSQFDGVDVINNYMYDDDAYISCPPNGANGVDQAFTKYDKDFKLYLKAYKTTNPLLAEDSYNAFSVYSNGGKKPMQTIPSGITKPIESPTNGSWDNIKNKAEGFKIAYFNDKRFGYDYFIEVNKQSGAKYPELNGLYFGGVKLSYDDKYNIIGDNLEYKYDFNNGDVIFNANNAASNIRKFYSSKVKINDGMELNCNDFGKSSGYDYEGNNGGKFKKGMPSSGDYMKKLDYWVEPCSYDINLETNIDDNGVYTVSGIVQPAERVEFSLDLRNRLVKTDTDKDGNKSGIYYKYSGDTISGDTSINKDNNKFYDLFAGFKFNQDDYNTTHNKITTIPYILYEGGTKMIPLSCPESEEYVIRKDDSSTFKIFDGKDSSFTEIIGGAASGNSFKYFSEPDSRAPLFDGDSFIEDIKFSFKVSDALYGVFDDDGFQFMYATSYMNAEDNNLFRRVIVLTKSDVYTVLPHISYDVEYNTTEITTEDGDSKEILTSITITSIYEPLNRQINKIIVYADGGISNLIGQTEVSGNSIELGITNMLSYSKTIEGRVKLNATIELQTEMFNYIISLPFDLGKDSAFEDIENDLGNVENDLTDLGGQIDDIKDKQNSSSGTTSDNTDGGGT